MPTYKVMSELLSELAAGGVDFNDVTLVFALGSHRRQTEAEKKKLAGEFAYQRIHIVDSDPENCIHMGVTANGTPVDITRAVAEADRRLALGNIEFHYFAGYSGGVKAVMPGVSTPAAIQSNHKLMIRPESCAGRLEGNPVREDIEEAGRICPVDFI
ncbi:MAG: lactate racemase domain-containing protein [Faecalispora jeddahensis]